MSNNTSDEKPMRVTEFEALASTLDAWLNCAEDKVEGFPGLDELARVFARYSGRAAALCYGERTPELSKTLGEFTIEGWRDEIAGVRETERLFPLTPVALTELPMIDQFENAWNMGARLIALFAPDEKSPRWVCVIQGECGFRAEGVEDGDVGPVNAIIHAVLKLADHLRGGRRTEELDS
jgi:hypothetical protein